MKKRMMVCFILFVAFIMVAQVQEKSKGETMATPATAALTPAQQALVETWEEHIKGEFETKSTEHTLAMDWMLPGIAPTGKRVEVPLVAIIKFQDGKVAHEHIYCDQACVLVQIVLLNPGKLPVAGRESAQKVLDVNSVPSNVLIERAHK
ncbi:MAG: hypothetical protein ACREOO_19505 [bacterium]